MSDTPAEQRPRKASSVRHTRAIQRDRSKRPIVAPPDPVVAARLAEVVHPATLAQVDHFRALGLRERALTLPVMAALVLEHGLAAGRLGRHARAALERGGLAVVLAGGGLR